MDFNKVLALLLLVCFVYMIQGKPLEESKSVANIGNDEMMDTAESQNPFLPRFAMKKLKERREKAKAQRRNNQRRVSHQKPPCPIYGHYYVSK